MLRGIEWELRVGPKVALVLPQGYPVEATQDHVMIGVMSGVPYGHIMEQTTVRLKDVVCPVPHLLVVTGNASRPAVLCPWKLAREEAICHIF